MSDENQKKNDVKKETKPESNNVFAKSWRGLLGKLTELRGEFRKIVWPSRDTLIKHTVTTIVISLIFGAFITLLDGLFGVISSSLIGFFS